MKIGFYKMGLQNKKVSHIFKGMYDSFFSSISKKVGFETTYISSRKDVSNEDIIVLPIGSGQDSDAVKIFRSFNGPVIIYVPPAMVWFRKLWLKRWRHRILFAYSTDESSYTRKKYSDILIPYITLPFGSDQNIFKSVQVEKKYDVFFAGNAMSGTGRYEYMDFLIKRSREKNWKVLLVGTGWENYGFPPKIINHGEEMNILYNSSKVCLNLSNNEQKLGEDKCLDANNRIFDLAMAGCCEISNAPLIIRKYFKENEVPAEDDPEKLGDLIDMYLNDENKRLAASTAARSSALQKHSWENRAQVFIDEINKTFPNFKDKKITRGFIFSIMRFYDQTGMDLFLYKLGLAYKKHLK